MKHLTSAQPSRLSRVLPWWLIVGGTIGLACAFIIMYEKLKLLQDPSYNVPCNLNPVISCGSVMKSAQSHIFGFPNPLIGLAAFPVLITTGVAMLGGSTFKRWYWRGLQVGAGLGLLFVHWLFFESVYRIHALCPYCMVVWAVTISTFWYLLLYNFEQGHLQLPAKYRQLQAFLRRHHADVLVLWFAVILGFILKHFWYYYGNKL